MKKTVTMEQRIAVCFWMTAFLLLNDNQAGAAGDLFERNSLTGRTALQVVVEELPQLARENGLHREELKTAMTRQLQSAGIPVAPQAENALYISLDASEAGTDQFTYVLSFEFLRLVLLFRDPSVETWGTTWSFRSVETLPTTQMRNLETLNKQGVNVFVYDYLVANEGTKVPPPLQFEGGR